MSKNVAMFVDVANMYYAARGQDVDVDYVALLKHATKGRDLIRAYAYTGLDPENENQRKFIDFLAKNGYKPVVKDIRKFGDGRMKANLDIELVVDLFRLADRMDIAVIVSGDGDFAPAIRALQDKGIRAEVISFKPNTSSDLVAVADEFTDIMKIASIGRSKGTSPTRASMSAPEMPAKEVSPEFGFREASPSVAAAALAAIKTGGTATTGRGSRGGSSSSRTTSSRTSSRRAAEPATEPETTEEAPAAVAETTPDGGEDGRRRRRRRGGRGRGRTRRDTDAVTPATGAGGEIGWEELDDLSQLDAVESPDREFSFEEADAATLAELGLTPDTTLEDGSAEKPKRSRTRKADPDGATDAKPQRRTRAGSGSAADGDAAEAEKPKRSRSRKPATTQASADGDETPGDETTGDAPPVKKPSRSRAKTSKSAEEPGSQAEATEVADGEPQGIWGRFRSARKPSST